MQFRSFTPTLSFPSYLDTFLTCFKTRAIILLAVLWIYLLSFAICPLLIVVDFSTFKFFYCVEISTMSQLFKVPTYHFFRILNIFDFFNYPIFSTFQFFQILNFVQLFCLFNFVHLSFFCKTFQKSSVLFYFPILTPQYLAWLIDTLSILFYVSD